MVDSRKDIALLINCTQFIISTGQFFVALAWRKVDVFLGSRNVVGVFLHFPWYFITAFGKMAILISTVFIKSFASLTLFGDHIFPLSPPKISLQVFATDLAVNQFFQGWGVKTGNNYCLWIYSLLITSNLSNTNTRYNFSSPFNVSSLVEPMYVDGIRTLQPQSCSKY